MDKFWIVNRPKPTQTIAEFDYEWGVMHVALMATTKGPLETFHRYTQHRSVEGVNEDSLLIGRSDEGWYGIADHWIQDFPALGGAFSPQYVQRMQPHNFADSAFVLELTEGADVVYDQEVPFTGRGGVKLVQFLRRRADVPQSAFLAHWQGAHAELIVDDARAGGPVRRYVQNPQLPLDPSFFAGTLFEAGGAQTYAGIEEIWFDDLAALHAFAGDAQRRAALEASLGAVVDLAGSFAMAVVERVVFDRTLPETPQPAIFDPDSFESMIAQNESDAGEWATIQPVGQPQPA